jgi:predicted amidohydrolase YtcJ
MPWWNPQATLVGSIQRLTLTNKPVSPEQAMTIEEAMYAHTMGGAYADFAESKKGSLEPGKFADLIVWHDDPYALKPADLFKSTIDLTMVGGKAVYEKG